MAGCYRPSDSPRSRRAAGLRESIRQRTVRCPSPGHLAHGHGCVASIQQPLPAATPIVQDSTFSTRYRAPGWYERIRLEAALTEVGLMEAVLTEASLSGTALTEATRRKLPRPKPPRANVPRSKLPAVASGAPGDERATGQQSVDGDVDWLRGPTRVGASKPLLAESPDRETRSGAPNRAQTSSTSIRRYRTLSAVCAFTASGTSPS